MGLGDIVETLTFRLLNWPEKCHNREKEKFLNDLDGVLWLLSLHFR
jgi:hypothetical protein